jgi:hypothetical protein
LEVVQVFQFLSPRSTSVAFGRRFQFPPEHVGYKGRQLSIRIAVALQDAFFKKNDGTLINASISAKAFPF